MVTPESLLDEESLRVAQNNTQGCWVINGEKRKADPKTLKYRFSVCLFVHVTNTLR
jgi:hypothetical protein